MLIPHSMLGCGAWEQELSRLAHGYVYMTILKQVIGYIENECETSAFLNVHTSSSAS
jgi:hypothetical protein